MQLSDVSYCHNPNTNQIFISDAWGDVIVYRRDTQKWQKLEQVSKACGGFACCIFNDNHIHLFGINMHNNHIIYDIKNKTYKTGVSLTHKYQYSKAIKLSNNKIFVIGGRYKILFMKYY